MTHFGIVRHESLTGGLLQGTGITAPDPEASPLDFIKSGKLTFTGSTAEIIRNINNIVLQNQEIGRLPESISAINTNFESINTLFKGVQDAFSNIGVAAPQVDPTKSPTIPAPGVETTTTGKFIESLDAFKEFLGPTGLIIGLVFVGVLLIKR